MATLGKPEFMEVGNPAAPFISAFAAGAAINLRRRQLEDQLMKMQLQSALKDRELQDKETLYGASIRLKDAEVLKNQAEAEGVVNKANKAANRYERLTALETAIDNLGDPGTKDYRTNLNQLRLPFADILGTDPEAKKVFNGAWSRHSAVAKEIVGGQAAVVKDFHEQMKSENMNPYWLENPDQWVYIDKSGKETTDTKNAVSRALKFGLDDKNNLIQLPSSAKSDDVKRWKTLPKDRFDSLVNQHKAYQGVISSIITGAQEPDRQAAAIPVSKPQPSIPVVATDDDYNNVPAGGYYVDPNGKTRQKPAQ